MRARRQSISLHTRPCDTTKPYRHDRASRSRHLTAACDTYARISCHHLTTCPRLSRHQDPSLCVPSDTTQPPATACIHQQQLPSSRIGPSSQPTQPRHQPLHAVLPTNPPDTHQRDPAVPSSLAITRNAAVGRTLPSPCNGPWDCTHKTPGTTAHDPDPREATRRLTTVRETQRDD